MCMYVYMYTCIQVNKCTHKSRAMNGIKPKATCVEMGIHS